MFDFHNKIAKTVQLILGKNEEKRSNPMMCSVDITAFNQIWNKMKLYQFLGVIDPIFDVIRREVRHEERMSLVEVTYASVRKETAMLYILGVASSGTRTS